MGILLLALGFLGLALKRAFVQAIIVFMSPIVLWIFAKVGLKIKRKLKSPAVSTEHPAPIADIPAERVSQELQLRNPALVASPQASHLLKGVLFAAAGWILILYGCYIGILDLWLWISTGEAYRWFAGSDETLGIIFRTPGTVLDVSRSGIWLDIFVGMPLFIYVLLLGFILGDLGTALVKQWTALRALRPSVSPKG